VRLSFKIGPLVATILMNDNFTRWNGNFRNARHRWQNAVPAEFNHWGHDVLPSLSSTFFFWGGGTCPQRNLRPCRHLLLLWHTTRSA